MSERHVTVREFAALTFRVLGVVILLGGLAQTLFLIPTLAQGDWASWGFSAFVALLTSLVFTGAVALPLIYHSDTIVNWLFAESEKTIVFALSSRDLLRCGLALVGVWFLATHLPYLARLAVEALWNAEGGRADSVGPDVLRRVAVQALGSVFACVAGWMLFRYAGRITDWWESRARGESRS